MLIDLTGKRFGKLIVIERDFAEREKNKTPHWKCICDCGIVKSVSGKSLRGGFTKFCQNCIDVAFKGKRFDRLVVIKKTEEYCPTQGYYWECKCDCGNICFAPRNRLENGQKKSCGCMQKDGHTALRHGMSKTRIWRAWQNMFVRCKYECSIGYSIYGGRGITVCEEWQEFEPFYDWALSNGYEEHLTIDRIDVNGNYEPSNCRWATRIEQQRNKRNNFMITHNDETKCLAEWADILGFNYKTIWQRMSKGKTFIEAISK